MSVASETLLYPDDEIVAAARSGYVESFGVLVDRYYAPLLRYLIRQTNDPTLAADVVQETFLSAFRHVDQLADDASFPGWLYQIARNHLRMELRRRRLRIFVSLEWLFDMGGDTRELGRPDETGTSQERDLIQRVLDDLSPTLREALLLHRLWGFSGTEIAQILQISPAAARKRVARAEEQFRARYQQLGGDDVASIA